MKNFPLKSGLLLLLLALAGLGCAGHRVPTQTTAEAWTPRKADQWFRSRAWANGLKLNVAESVDKMEFARQYAANKAWWDKAFVYLRDTNLDQTAPGKYPIDGDNVFASMTDNPTQDVASTQWESHKKYIDLQYVVRGAEKIGVAPISTATMTKPYEEARDAANYRVEGQQYEARPGTIYIFFPSDVHRPNIKVDGIDKDKKVVVKVRVAQ